MTPHDDHHATAEPDVPQDPIVATGFLICLIGLVVTLWGVFSGSEGTLEVSLVIACIGVGVTLLGMLLGFPAGRRVSIAGPAVACAVAAIALAGFAHGHLDVEKPAGEGGAETTSTTGS